MELNDLKSSWQQAGEASKNEADLLKMSKLSNHPTLKRVRIKLIVESMGLLLFLFIYYDWFDGHSKPFYANLLLVLGLLIYMVNDIIGYFSISKPTIKNNIKLSILNYLKRIKRLSILSLITSFMFSISVILYFTPIINFTEEKVLILGGMIITLLLMIGISFKTWSERINIIKQQFEEFNVE